MAGLVPAISLRMARRDGAPRARARGDPDKPAHDEEEVSGVDISQQRPDLLARIGAAIARVADALTNLMFVGVFLAFIYKIVMRYAFGDAVAWADEVTVVLFIWIVFIANGFVVDDRRQISFDLIYRHLTERSQRRIAAARIVLVGGIFLYALPAAVDYILFLWRERTPVLRLRLDYVDACFAVFMLAVIIRMAYRLVLLAGARWRQGL
jgi:TRAP-type C4-dicarboxylate transport system permease small subunit